MNQDATNPAGGAGEESLKLAVEEVLAEHPFLKGMKKEHIRLLADNAMRTNYLAGDYVFRQDDPANRFYLIEKGKVSLEYHRRDDAPLVAQVLGPGEVIGWSWLFPPYFWHCDARVTEPTTAIFLYGTRLRDQCEADHDFGYEMLKRMNQVVVQRLQTARRQMTASPR